MSQPKLISPLLDNFLIGEPMSDHNGIQCCPAMNSETSEKYILKVISLPPSRTQLDALLLTGVLKDEEEAKKYYQQRTQDWVDEIRILQQLSKQEGFISCDNYQVVPAEDGIGSDIYILTPYKRTLARQLKKKPFTQLDALNLGMDICSALASCRRNGYLFTNLKPSNIFVLENGEYKIGDLGFLNLNSLHYAAIAEHCISNYTAPEIKDASSSINETVDTYALGMVLYSIFNNGILPEDLGSALPAPQYADEEMSQIILKACDPDPQARWENPAQMGQMLVNYMQKNGVSDVPIVAEPAVEAEPENAENPAADETPAETVEQDDSENVTVTSEAAEEQPSDPNDSPEETGEENSAEAEPSMEENNEAPQSPAVADAQSATDEIEEAVGSGETEDAENSDNAEAEEIPIANILADRESEDELTADQHQQIMDILDNHDAFSEEAAEIKAAAAYLEIDTTQEIPDDISYEDVSEEVIQILSQADALADMEVPEPVVAPEAIEITPTANEDQATDVSDNDEAENEEPNNETDITEEELYMNENHNQSDDRKLRRPHWLRHTIIIAILLLLIAGGFLFFKFYMQETVSKLELTGTNNSLIVKIESEADESLLSVTCQNKYGTEITAPVLQGVAEFTGLSPNMTYEIRVNISGLHILTGETKQSHTTAKETVLLQYNVITGNEIGTVELNFTFDGPSSDNWTLTYATDGYEPQSQSFSGTNLTISGLQPYKTYNGVLTPEADLFITEPISVSFSATELVQANDLTITGCSNGKLNVEWKAPDSVAVESWTVRCYSTAEGSTYDQTHTTSATSFEFRELNSAESFIVEVKADGQTIVQKATVGANSVTVSNLTLAEYNNSQATLTWDCETTPQNGWIISYTVDNAPTAVTMQVSDKTAVISGMIPNAEYAFTVQSADDVHTFCNTVTYKTAETDNFSIVINNTKILAEDIEFSLFRHPSNENWTRYDITNSHYTNAFTLEQEAGFVGFLDKKYEESNTEFYITIAIRNESGEIVGIVSHSGTWKSIWSNNYNVFLLPTLPNEVGLYSVSVYLNGQFAYEQPFTIS